MLVVTMIAGSNFMMATLLCSRNFTAIFSGCNGYDEKSLCSAVPVTRKEI